MILEIRDCFNELASDDKLKCSRRLFTTDGQVGWWMFHGVLALRTARFDATNKKLQQANLDLNLTILLLKSLLTFLQSLRERFDELKKKPGLSYQG